MNKKIEMKDIVELCKSRGFVYAGSEIYGGLANSWDYGPYGSLLKENIKNLWIKEFVQKRDDMVLLDAAILMNSQVWIASGHVGGFSDPLMDCKSCKQRLRADKLIEDYLEKTKDTELPIEWAGEATPTQNLTNYILEKEIVCPYCGKKDFSDIRKFNLMFKTFQGVTEDSASQIYLRPETAGGIFVNFANILRTSRKKLPFGVAQVGKSFRNEITPGNFIFRTREFEQMEIEYFCEPGNDLELHKKWKEDFYNFFVNILGVKKENLRFRDHGPDELSFYSNATSDIEYNYPFGWGELQGIANRTDYDLKTHMQHSKVDLSYFDPVNNKKFIPYVIEPSLGLTRLLFVLLIDSYTVEQKADETRTYLKLDPKIAPIKVGVLPVVKKLSDIAKLIYKQLSEDFMCEYDDVGSVGKRYARFDEIGAPFCVTIDSENYEKGLITVRYRDSMEQELIKISTLNEFLKEKMK